MNFLRYFLRTFTAGLVARVRRPGRLARAVALAAAVGAVAPVTGCGPATGGGSAPMVKDPPPLPPEETTEALIQQKAKSRPAAGARPRAR